MELARHVCWTESRLFEAMATMALQDDNALFLATHHPVRASRAQTGTGESLGRYVTEEDILQDFLDDDRDHVLAAVIGAAGSGKSHLIRWLSLNITDDETRRVILVPRANTNLRGIIELIIGDMEGGSIPEYRERLKRAVSGLTPGQLRQQFLAQMAIAVGPEGPGAATRLDDQQADDERRMLIESLPALLNDDVFRNGLLENTHVVDEIADRIAGDPGSEQSGELRKFRTDDLAVDTWGLLERDLNANARDLFTWLRDNQGFRVGIVDWLNENLDWAVRSMLNLTSTDIETLMLDVRRELALQNRELVLLIEDLAKMQSIEAALLEALIVPPDEVNRDICRLRSFMGMTSGTYNGLDATALDRIELLITLDSEAYVEEEDGLRTRIAEFAAPYLNAVRLTGADLDAWYAKASAQDGPGPSVPVRCADCGLSDDCHRIFGHVDGIGLYPFNARALEVLYKRQAAANQKSPEYLNPRILIRNVLQSVLNDYTGTLRDGTFPPRELGDHFKTRFMSGANLAKLRERVAPQYLDRFRTLIEIWGDGVSQVTPEELLAAFDLPILPTQDRPPRIEIDIEYEGLPVDLNLTITSGDTLEKLFAVSLSMGGAPSTRINFGDATQCQARFRADDGDTRSFGLTAGPQAGDIDLRLDGDATRTLPAGAYTWEMVLSFPKGAPQFPNGSEFSLISGNATVIPGEAVRPPDPPEIPEIDEWMNQNRELSQRTAQLLREALFEAVREAIDWDVLGLSSSFLCGQGRCFRPTSINFRKQATQPGKADVEIELPMEDDYTSTALALQGAVLFRHHGGWAFDDGPRYLMHYAMLLDAIADSVVTQLRRLTCGSGHEQWDPAKLATKLLALAVVIDGSMPSEGTPAQQLDALFAYPGGANAELARSQDWQRLSNACGGNGDDLRSILLAHAGRTKGGASAQMVDAAEILVHLTDFLGEFTIDESVPQEAPSEYRPLRELKRAFDKGFDSAVNAERTRQVKMAREVTRLVGEATRGTTVEEQLNTAMNLASRAGVAPDAQRALENVLAAFRPADLDACLRHMADIDPEAAPADCVLSLARRDRTCALATSHTVITEANTYLSQLKTRVDTAIEALGKAGDLKKSLVRLREGISTIFGITGTVEQWGEPNGS